MLLIGTLVVPEQAGYAPKSPFHGAIRIGGKPCPYSEPVASILRNVPELKPHPTMKDTFEVVLGKHTVTLRKHRNRDAIDLIVISLNSVADAAPRDVDPSSESARLEILTAVRGLDEAGVAETLEKAKRGDPRAQLILGIAYQQGVAVDQDAAAAVDWYKKAAEQGHALAQCNLACSYAFGEGVPSDYREAARWYTPAAEQDFWPAQVNLAFLYARGLGVRQDEDESLRLYVAAANHGLAPAQYAASTAILHGSLTPSPSTKDRAQPWLLKASRQGHAPSTDLIGELGNNALEKSVHPSTRDIWVTAASQGSAFGALRASQTFIGPGFGIKRIEGVLVDEPDKRCAWLRIASALNEVDVWADYRTEDQDAELRRALEKTLPDIESKLDNDQRAECERIASDWISSRKLLRQWPTGLDGRRLLIAKIPIHRGCLIDQALQPGSGTVIRGTLAVDEGAISPGMEADIIALDGDPLADPAALDWVAFVMRAGRVYKNEPGRTAGGS